MVEQRVLLEPFDDQTNLLPLEAGPVKRSTLVRRSADRADFTLR